MCRNLKSWRVKVVTRGCSISVLFFSAMSTIAQNNDLDRFACRILSFAVALFTTNDNWHRARAYHHRHAVEPRWIALSSATRMTTHETIVYMTCTESRAIKKIHKSILTIRILYLRHTYSCLRYTYDNLAITRASELCTLAFLYLYTLLTTNNRAREKGRINAYYG